MRATLSVAFLFSLGKTGAKQTFVQPRLEVMVIGINPKIFSVEA
jgi:hypothetical protein